MMLLWLWIFLPNPNIEPIKLEELGTFQSLHLQLYKCGDQFLALIAKEPRITLFNTAGKITAVYEKRGHGAEDLYKPQFLGATQNQLFILSDHRRLLIFDHQLRLLESKDSGLPPYISQGLLFGNNLGKNQFLLYAFLQNNFLLHQVRLDYQFQIQKSYYQRETSLKANGTYQWAHRNRHFVADMIPANSDFYIVEVRNMILKNNLREHPVLTELIAPLDSFHHSSFRERAILSEMATTDDGYLVELAVFPPSRQKKGSDDFSNLLFFWDYFDTKGTNLKREEAGERRLKPVRNSSEIFIVANGPGDVEFIVPFAYSPK